MYGLDQSGPFYIFRELSSGFLNAVEAETMEKWKKIVIATFDSEMSTIL